MQSFLSRSAFRRPLIFKLPNLESRVHHQRYFSSEATKETKKPELKSLLRRFYLLVHPDRFADHPHEKAVNEQSMKEFLAFIAEYKKRPFGSPLANPRRIPMKFYIKGKQANGQGLQQIEAEMLLNASNPHAAKRRLMNLFASCGLESDFHMDSMVDSLSLKDDTYNLHSFLNSNLQTAHDVVLKNRSDMAIVNQLVTSLERDFHIKVTISTGSDSSWTLSENKQVLLRFADLIHTLTTDGWIQKMAHTEVNLDSEIELSHVASNGIIYLSRVETNEQWEKFLKSQDWNIIKSQQAIEFQRSAEEERRRNAEDDARKLKESQLANMLAIRQVKLLPYSRLECRNSAQQNTTLNPPAANGAANTEKKEEEEEEDDYDFDMDKCNELCNQFLDHMFSHKNYFNAQRQRNGRKFRSIELGISPNMPPHMTHHLDPTGVLRVSTRVTPQQLISILQNNGPQAVELAREETQWETVRDFVEVRLGLSMLTVDYHFFYSAPQAVYKTRLALRRMQDMADFLRSLNLRGLTVAVSDQYGIGADGTVFLRWDFDSEAARLLLAGGSVS